MRYGYFRHDVAGVGPSTATLLAEHGIRVRSHSRRHAHERLVSIPGFGAARARSVLAAAAERGRALPAKRERADKKRKEEAKEEGQRQKAQREKGQEVGGERC